MKLVFAKLAATSPKFILSPASTGICDIHAAEYESAPCPGSVHWCSILRHSVTGQDAAGSLPPTFHMMLSSATLLSANAGFNKLQQDSLYHGYTCASLTASATIDTHEILRLLCLDSESAFTIVTVTLKSTGRGGSKQAAEMRSTIYDPAWNRNIRMETLQLHRERRSDPPSSRRVQHAGPLDCFKAKESLRARTIVVAHPSPQIVRFALDSTALPLITETLPVAEAARRALIRLLTDVRGRQQYRDIWDRQKHKAGIQPVLLHGVLTGKDEHSNPLVGHTHAYFLPTDEDNDGRIDHLTTIARAGFSVDEMRAIARLRSIKLRNCGNASHPLRVLMRGFGCLDEYRPPLLQSSCKWVSVTPYIATRHPKTRGCQRIDRHSPYDCANFLIADLRMQLRHLLNNIIDEQAINNIIITPLWDTHGVFHCPSGGDRYLQPIHFKRRRAKCSDDGNRRLTGAFTLEFNKPINPCGPIAAGWSSHFGMGLFVPESASVGQNRNLSVLAHHPHNDQR